MSVGVEKQEIFNRLYWAETEDDVSSIIEIEYPETFCQRNWKPYGEQENNYAIVENQQDNPIAALIEKITNSIDAILMKHCYERGIDPRSTEAPGSIEKAVNLFFPDKENWDLSRAQSRQAENIQIIAHGPRKETSLVIYDNGEGQHPEEFEKTLLSLLRGNKNDIPFVQGKYNMGGSGAIVFCGKKRYQLVASKRHDSYGNFGFTLVRKHPFSREEQQKYKNTWYEYLTIDGGIPSFEIKELDLKLRNRKFTTGTIIKLYSYNLPRGSRSVISRDLNQSVNEYLFEPALPVFMIDNNERYPKDIMPERTLYGLKRRLEEDDSKYIYKKFTEEVNHATIGKFKIACYVFNFQIPGKSSKESRETIRREFFKNNMAVLFSINGQVHGNYTNEFISRSLKWQLFKNHVLIHVDCSHLKQDFRSELFMASRDRLKKAEESNSLREKIAEVLRRSQLKDIYQEFRAKITNADSSSDELIKQFSKNLPLNPELSKLLKNTFSLDQQVGNKHSEKQGNKKRRHSKKEPLPFDPQQYPSSLKIETKQREGELPVVQLPVGQEKSIRFSTDVEDEYFDRINDPGELSIALLEYSSTARKGHGHVIPTKISEVLSVAKSSPDRGTIRVHMRPTSEVNVGDSIKIKATLSNSIDDDIEQIFLVKISDKSKKVEAPKGKEPENLGLPKAIEVKEGSKTWRELGESGIEFDHTDVMHPLVEGDLLDTIYINMDSYVLKRFSGKLKTEEEIDVAKKRYISTVYFHTLFLYMINRNKEYIFQNNDGDPIDLQDYLRDVFKSYYAEFLLNFEISNLHEALSE